MRNANKCPKIRYSAMLKKMKKWSGIHTRIRIATKSQPLLEGHALPVPVKFGRRPFPRSSVILFTEWQNQLLYRYIEVHSVESIYLRQRCFDASKPRVAALTGAQYQYVGFSRRKNKFHVAVHTTQNHSLLLLHAPNSDFPDVIKFRVAVHTLWKKAIRFRHPDYDPDRAQKLISSSVSRHLSTRNISSKSMHAFLSSLANRQTDRQTDRRTRARGRKHTPPPLSEVTTDRTIT